jgi:hypothetical protein
MAKATGTRRRTVRKSKPDFINDFSTNMYQKRERIGSVKWTQRDGKKIFLRDMTSEHIGKCIIMLMTKIEKLDRISHSSYGSSSQGEFSQMEAEHSADAAHRDAERVKAMIEIFRDELMFRAMPEFAPNDFRAVANTGEVEHAHD